MLPADDKSKKKNTSAIIEPLEIEKQANQNSSGSGLLDPSIQDDQAIIDAYNALRTKIDDGNGYELLRKIIGVLNEEQRVKKAARHFNDALNAKRIRHDLEFINNPILRLCYGLQRSGGFLSLLSFASVVHMIGAFLEPDYRGDQNKNGINIVVPLEFTIITLYFIDVLTYIVMKCFDRATSFRKKYLHEKFIIKLICIGLFVYDDVRYFGPSDEQFFLFICIRPGSHCCKGFFSMMALIFDLLVLFLCVVLIATVISLKVMHVSHEAAGGEEEEELELYINEYGSFGPSFVTLWMGLFGEGYPENMIPQYMGNSLILFFFIPYMLIGKFILEPIPVALLEHSYKHSRSHNMVVDRHSKYVLTKESFIKLLAEMMGAEYEPEDMKNIVKFFDIIDDRQNGYIELEDFYELPILIRSHPGLRVKLSQTGLLSRVAQWCNSKLRLKSALRSNIYAVITILISLLNYTLLALHDFTGSSSSKGGHSTTPVKERLLSESGSTTENDPYLPLYIAIIVFYTLDACARLFSYGGTIFFGTALNFLDLLLLTASYLTWIPLSIGRFLLAIFTLRNSWVIVKVWSHKNSNHRQRGCCVKLFQPISHVFERIGALLSKIFKSIPLILSLVPMVLTFTYFFAAIGVFLFNDNKSIPNAPKRYFGYTHFNDLGPGFLSLFQIFFDQLWNRIVIDTVNRSIYPPWVVILYFDAYHFLMDIVLFSIVDGLIWEFFLRVEENLEDLEKSQHADEARKTLESAKASEKLVRAANLTRGQRILQRTKELLRSKGQAYFNELIDSFREQKRARALLGALQGDDKSEPSEISLGNEPKHNPKWNKFYSEKFRLVTTLREDALTAESPKEEIEQRQRMMKKMSGFQEFLTARAKKELRSRDKLKIQMISRDIIMQQALLKMIDQDAVNAHELEYFIERFGQYYIDYCSESHTKEIAEINKHSALLKNDLIRVLRGNEATPSTLVWLLNLVENTLNEVQLPHGSVAKIIFEENNGGWFCFTQPTGSKTGYRYIRKGPWNMIDELFPFRDGVYMMDDAFSSKNMDSKSSAIIEHLFESFQLLAQHSRTAFESYTSKMASWSVFAVPLSKNRLLETQVELKETKIIRNAMLLVARKNENLVSMKELRRKCKRPGHSEEPSHGHGHAKHSEHIELAVTQLYRRGLPSTDLFEELKDFQGIFARYEEQILGKVRNFRWFEKGGKKHLFGSQKP